MSDYRAEQSPRDRSIWWIMRCSDNARIAHGSATTVAEMVDALNWANEERRKQERSRRTPTS